MIAEHIQTFNISQLPNLLQKGIALLKETDFASQEVGAYHIEGEDLFYQVQEYNTVSRESTEAELHKKYCDIQYIVSGNEAIGWASANNEINTSTFDNDNDIIFFPPTQNESFLLLEKGMFVFFAPYEIHRPRLQFSEGTPEFVKKIVVKINMEKIFGK